MLLKHQNKEFKQFRLDQDLSLQETNKIFKLYALSVDALAKIRKVINQVIIKREQNRKHSTKDALFNIQSLANQLSCSQSTILNGPKPGKIFFIENLAPDLWKKVFNQLHISVLAFNKFLHKNGAIKDSAIENGNKAFGIRTIEYPIEIYFRANKEVN